MNIKKHLIWCKVKVSISIIGKVQASSVMCILLKEDLLDPTTQKSLYSDFGFQ